jgi:hypothetical protein
MEQTDLHSTNTTNLAADTIETLRSGLEQGRRKLNDSRRPSDGGRTHNSKQANPPGKD